MLAMPAVSEADTAGVSSSTGIRLYNRRYSFGFGLLPWFGIPCRSMENKASFRTDSGLSEE
jgi:hypothetical protein